MIKCILLRITTVVIFVAGLLSIVYAEFHVDACAVYLPFIISCVILFVAFIDAALAEIAFTLECKLENQKDNKTLVEYLNDLES
jgi:hypothetical protein